MANTIHVTQPDFDQLERLVDGWWAPDDRSLALLERLRDELDRARVVDSGEIAPECVTLGSEVTLRDLDTGRRSVHRLVLPKESHKVEGALSVLSPIGIAVLGYHMGDSFTCETPGGERRLLVEKVVSPTKREQSERLFGARLVPEGELEAPR